MGVIVTGVSSTRVAASALLILTAPASTRSCSTGNRRVRGRTRTSTMLPQGGDQLGLFGGGAMFHDSTARTIGWFSTKHSVCRSGVTTSTAWSSGRGPGVSWTANESVPASVQLTPSSVET